ncbi:MAG: aldo/keto reductase [Lachnospiraceae bacterium]|nr:aldo/keto reductase [Lachnospiraceae bacterium]
MIYRKLGNTGLLVSEIGLGGEWLERHNAEEVKAVVDACRAEGINIIDCFMSEPNVRSNIGNAIQNDRENWIIQGHIGSAWRNGQYVRTRDLAEVKEAFADLLARFHTSYMDLGMIHFVDRFDDWNTVLENGFMDYMLQLKADGAIRHIGLSTHNPDIARLAVEHGAVEVILFSLNPAYDLLPATENIDDYFVAEYDTSLAGIDPGRAQLYKLCEQKGVALTVMKGFAGGRLLDEKRSPFGTALTPVQCLHYALTRPAVASVLIGFDNPGQVPASIAYESADDDAKDYASVLAGAPRHAYKGQCTYCGHCKPCPKNIDIAMVNKLYDLAVMQEEIPASVKEHYAALQAHASDCISCRACEGRCPFEVKITDRMKQTAELFGY